MKVVSTEALTKLIQLVKSAFIKVDDVVEVTEIETEIPSEITLAAVATSGDYNDLSNKPTIPATQVNSDWDATSGVAQILNKPTIPTVNNPTITFTQGGTTKGTITLNQSSDQTIALDAGARNIGQIIQSTIPLTDAGLHLLDGSVIQGNGIYSEFVDFIKNLHQQDPNGSWITDENGWQASVTQYGVCGKFAIDYPNNTVRLPKITGFIEGTTDVTALGDLIQAGLPNITGTFQDGNEYGSTDQMSGAFYRTDLPGHTPFSGNGSPNRAGFDASRSNPIYGRSNTVQPQSIKVLYYIVIATSTKTDIEVDIDEIATDLNGKADVDLSNINTNGKSFVSGLGMPSSRYIDLTLGASGSSYTAPANGWFLLYMHTTTSGSLNWAQLVNWSKNDFVNRISTNISNDFSIFLPVNKGDIVGLDYGNIDLSYSWNKFRFYYTEGENV